MDACSQVLGGCWAVREQPPDQLPTFARDIPLGTLADAWQPELPFEQDLSVLSDQQLQVRANYCSQAASNDPEIILKNLQAWRLKYCYAEQSSSRSTLEDYRSKVEAIRAKARLLFLQQKAEAWFNKPVFGTRQQVCRQAAICFTASTQHITQQLSTTDQGSNAFSHTLQQQLVRRCLATPFHQTPCSVSEPLWVLNPAQGRACISHC